MLGFIFFSIVAIVISALLSYELVKDNFDFGKYKSGHDSGMDVAKLKNTLFKTVGYKNFENLAIDRKTGVNTLTITDAGVNKAMVMATLRQITDMNYENAQKVVNHVPATFLVNVSEKEAELTKQALEFVGAKIEIK